MYSSTYKFVSDITGYTLGHVRETLRPQSQRKCALITKASIEFNQGIDQILKRFSLTFSPDIPQCNVYQYVADNILFGDKSIIAKKFNRSPQYIWEVFAGRRSKNKFEIFNFAYFLIVERRKLVQQLKQDLRTFALSA